MSRVGITFAKIKVGAAYSKLRALTSASRINASALLDYDTKNRYFTDEFAGFTDATSFTVQKVSADSATFIDSIQSIAVEKALDDSFGVVDLTEIVMTYFRAPSDSFTFSDAQIIGTGLSKTDVVTVAEVLAKDLSTFASDSAAVSETATIGFAGNYVDDVSVSDSLVRLITYQRSFSDTFTLDDFTDIAAIEKDTTATKTNIVGLGDVHFFTTEKTLADTATLADIPALGFAKPAEESVSISDVFQKVAVFPRQFTDTATVSEQLATNTGKALSDSAALSESVQIASAFARTLADAVTFAEQTTAAFGKNFTDSATITESLDIQMTSVASSVLNAGAFNTVPLNN